MAAWRDLGVPEFGTWRLAGLERLVDEYGDRFPDRVDEWRYYIDSLRGFTEPDGLLPPTFEELVWETFVDLIHTAREAERPTV